MQETIQQETKNRFAPNVVSPPKYRIPFDPRWQGFYFSWWMRDCWRLDKFFGIMIEGRQRIGKSSYAFQALAEAAGTPHTRVDGNVYPKPDYEKIKSFIVFTPQEFLEKVREIWDRSKQMAIVWDDAGYWLFALDWYKPLVKVVAKTMNLIGTKFSTIILTTPDLSQVSSKVIEAMPDLYECKVLEIGRDTITRKYREARVYMRWRSVDRKRYGVKTKWHDLYDAMLPQEFYDWYHPKRESYLGIALKELDEALKHEQRIARRRARVDKQEQEEAYKSSVVAETMDSDKVRELEEIIKDIEVRDEAAGGPGQ
jgi:hypothetical protein